MSKAADGTDLTQLLAHAAWARRLARALVAPGDADDLCQEVWVKALERPTATRQPRAWLATVLRRLGHNRFRSADRRRARERAAAPADPLPTPEQSLGRLEIQRLLADRVEALEEPFRQTLLLRYFDGRSAAEIARRLAVPAGTIRWRLSSALDRLRAALDRGRPEWRRDWALLVLPGGTGAAAPSPPASTSASPTASTSASTSASPPASTSASPTASTSASTSASPPASTSAAVPRAPLPGGPSAGGALAPVASAGIAVLPVLFAAVVVAGGVAAVAGLQALAELPAHLPLPGQLALLASAPPGPPPANPVAPGAAVPAAALGPDRAAPALPAGFVPFDRFPPALVQAFVAAQDRRFFDHEGVDLRAMGRALLTNLETGGVEQGGSTITQQLAKLSLGPEPTVARKLRQVVLAHELERRYSKQEILTLYLNGIFLGEGAFGVQAAARRYFSREVPELDVGQCALLAGIAHAPARTSPRRHPQAARARRDNVLQLMVKTGALTAAQAEQAAHQPL